MDACYCLWGLAVLCGAAAPEAWLCLHFAPGCAPEPRVRMHCRCTCNLLWGRPAACQPQITSDTAHWTADTPGTVTCESMDGMSCAVRLVFAVLLGALTARAARPAQAPQTLRSHGAAATCSLAPDRAGEPPVPLEGLPPRRRRHPCKVVGAILHSQATCPWTRALPCTMHSLRPRPPTQRQTAAPS